MSAAMRPRLPPTAWVAVTVPVKTRVRKRSHFLPGAIALLGSL